MKNAATKSDHSGNLTQREIFSLQMKLVEAVARCYLITRDLPVLSSSDYDPIPAARSRRWTPDSCHYIVDVENTVRRALKGKPDEGELRDTWQALLDREGVAGKTDERLVRILGPVFRRNRLDPADYFRTIRKGSPQRRPA